LVEALRQINDFEQLLSANGVKILKFFLAHGKEEQKRRFQARILDPTRNWKISLAISRSADMGRLHELTRMRFRNASTDEAPWHASRRGSQVVRNYLVRNNSTGVGGYEVEISSAWPSIFER